MSKLSPFDFIKSINEGTKGKNLLGECSADKEVDQPDSLDKQYVPFIVNKGLSYFQDTVLFANEMNVNYELPAKMQYDFLKNVIRPRRRFSKWDKKIKPTADILLIQEAWGYSKEKAEAVYEVLSEDDMKEIKQYLNKGGVK